MAKSLAVLAVLVHVAAAAHAPQRMQNRMANMAKQESPLFPQEASPIVLQEAKREMNNIATVGGGGDELSERGSSPRRASFGDVLNGRFQNDRLQHIADNFRLRQSCCPEQTRPSRSTLKLCLAPTLAAVTEIGMLS